MGVCLFGLIETTVFWEIIKFQFFALLFPKSRINDYVRSLGVVVGAGYVFHVDMNFFLKWGLGGGGLWGWGGFWLVLFCFVFVLFCSILFCLLANKYRVWRN